MWNVHYQVEVIPNFCQCFLDVTGIALHCITVHRIASHRTAPHRIAFKHFINDLIDGMILY
jgi:hypothetical protein